MRINLRRSYIALATLALAAVLIAGCSRGFVQYQPTPLPADVTELFELYGNPDADTVWIFAQGGPFHMLISGVLAGPDGETIYAGYDAFRHFTEYGDIRFVHVHQTLTLNHELAERDAEWTLAELQAEVDVSVEILHRTIEHFKAQGKHVVVIGHSYGAFLVTRYLARRGPEAADRYLIMAGRLDMPREVVEGFLAGVWWVFPDAVTPTEVPGQDDPLFPPKAARELMEMRIAGATGHDRYTEELADTNLDRAIYVYGTNDFQVGRLAADEVAFLRSRGGTVIEVRRTPPDPLEGDHRAMFDPDHAERISEALKQ